MADVTISGLNELTSVDRAADMFEIADASDGNKSKRSSVNSMLDLTSHPVGIDEVQTLTNKTLTAPTVSSPVLSGTVTGTYTIGGTPTFPSSVVTLTGSQTLTNKVLTSPTINNPVIANPTLTVDTVSEYTAANGVTIDGLNIKDGKLVTANSVVATNITAGILTNAMLSTTAGELGGSWTSYTPTWTSTGTQPAIGNGTIVGKYLQIGKLVFFRIVLTFGSTTSVGTGSYRLSLPTTANETAVGLMLPMGQWGISAAANYAGHVDLVSSTTVGALTHSTTTGGQSGGEVTHNSPLTWANGNVFAIKGFYEAV